MARTPLLNIRVDAEARVRWKAEADRRDISLAELVRESVEAALTGEQLVPAAAPASPPKREQVAVASSERRWKGPDFKNGGR